MSTADDLIVTQPGLIASLAERFGAPEPAFRLLITIVAGYPIAAIYRNFILELPNKSLHHIFFALNGILLCAFNYGSNLYHSVIAILVTYLLVRLLRTLPKQFLAINFIFHMCYLLVGYYCTESNEYDILWTMPHCVLVLRMIGFGFDITDGQKPSDQLTKDQIDTHLTEVPTLLELFGFAYFPSAFLIGPQFPYRRYKKFIDAEFRQYEGAIEAGLKRMFVGFAYLAARQFGSMWIPDDYLLSDAFRNQNLIMRLVYLGLWGKFSLYKYISCWLLTEGALMCIGFSYNGKVNGVDDWYGCSNVKLIILEKGNTMQDYVQSFNVNTNQWVAQYVYKRLRFLNNRTVSYAAALAFLAVWHGFHSGYYMAFLLEYMIVTIEKQIESVYNAEVISKYERWESFLPYKCLKILALKSYNIIYMGWCLTPFIFLSYSRYIRVFAAVNYSGFIYMTIWTIIHQIYKRNKRAAALKKKATTVSNDTPTLTANIDSNNKKVD